MGEDERRSVSLNWVLLAGYREAFSTVRIINWWTQGSRVFLDPPSLEVLKDLTRQHEQPGLTS